jgi:PAS domain S-box-containing protein
MNPSFTTNFREMTPWLQTILHDYQDAVIITNRHFDMLHWNAAAEELWNSQINRPAYNNFISFLEQLSPAYADVHAQLQKVVALNEPEENIFFTTLLGKTLHLSCYTHKFPGAQYLPNVIIIIRDVQSSLHYKNEPLPNVRGEELLYKNLLNTLEEGVLLVEGEEGTIISANKKACEIIGAPRDRLIGKYFTKLPGTIVREDGTPMNEYEIPALVTLRTGESVKQTVAGYKSSTTGRTIWLSVNTSLLEEQRPGLAAVSFFDITARKEAESKLSEAEAIFRSFMNNTNNPAWISDEDGNIIYMNEVFKDVWKLTDADLNRNMYDMLPNEMVEEYVTNNRKVLDSGAPLVTIEQSLRRDGSPGIYVVYKFLLQSSDGKRLIGGQSIDITDEKTAQEEIIKSNERFYYATKATSDSIWDWNIEKGHIYRSESFTRLTGYSLNDTEKTLFWFYDKIHPEDRERVVKLLDNSLQSNNNYWHDEYRFICADGSQKYLADKAYVIYKNGKPVRAIGAIQDLTEKRKLEAELALQKEKERLQINRAMIAGQDLERNEISKELHDNVNQILSSATILLSAAQGNTEDQEHLIQKTNEYLNLAIQEIRKITKSLNSTVVKEVGLMEPVQDIIKTMQLLKAVDVEFDCDPSLEYELTQDIQLMLYRIIQEQTNNIIRYAEASQVIISINKSDGFITLLIQDNGKGFDITKQAKGIGLINILNRAEIFGGSMHIDTKPGNGVRLEVKVPVRQ